MYQLILTFILGLVIGAVFVACIGAGALKSVVSVDITVDTFGKASALCEERGERLTSMTAYYDRDVLYCEGLKIIAKKDDKQKMWISFEEVRPASS